MAVNSSSWGAFCEWFERGRMSLEPAGAKTVDSVGWATRAENATPIKPISFLYDLLK